MTRDPLVRQHALLLSLAAQTVADPQVRHRGTFGGSLAHADPAADMPARRRWRSDAEIVIAGPGGRRTVPAAEFFTDLFTTAIGDGELLVEVRVPKHTGWGAHYEKFNHVAQSWSIVGGGRRGPGRRRHIAQARVALTNMGLVPIRATAVEEALVGSRPPRRPIRAAAQHAAEGTSPMSRRQRRRGLPAAPREGAHRAGGARRGRRLRSHRLRLAATLHRRDSSSAVSVSSGRPSPLDRRAGVGQRARQRLVVDDRRARTRRG